MVPKKKKFSIQYIQYIFNWKFKKKNVTDEEE